MTYLDTDKQTYADLSITETANNEQFLFSLFSKTETKEGKSLMMNWIMYPLSDLDMIRKRQEAVAWDALPELLLNEEELDFIEYYLAYRDQIREAHVLLSCATVIDRLLRYDSTRYVICRGVKLVIHLLHCLERWAKELDEDAPQLMKESARMVNDILSGSELGEVLEQTSGEERRLSISMYPFVVFERIIISFVFIGCLSDSSPGSEREKFLLYTESGANNGFFG